MSETKHTPGPWSASEHGDYSDYDGRCIVILGDDDTIKVCAVIGDDDEETNATARLITVAPDLLECLQDFAAQYACGCGHPACNNCERDRDAREVIAKAKGQAHD